MSLRFTKKLIAAQAFEAAAAFDVDGDGHLDIVSGGFWYRGPDFREWFLIRDVQRVGEYYDDFSTIPIDINGNGRLDIVTGGWWGNTLRWRENPEDPTGEWAEHIIAEVGHVETTRAWDVDGDGLNDLIVGGAHNYELARIEQRRGRNGSREWIRHSIDPFNSQYHDLQWADIDGDSQPELITGKRYRAHCGKDPGAFDEIGIYIFKWTGEGFAKQVVSYGEPGVGTGCGIQFHLCCRSRITIQKLDTRISIQNKP